MELAKSHTLAQAFKAGEMNGLEEKLGFVFKDKSLLKLALTHKNSGLKNYERLEFLGDRVLGLAISDMLYRHFAHEDEGDMAKRFVTLVCESALLEIADSLSLDKFLIAPKNRKDLQPRSRSACADAMEALIGAVYLDAGFDSALRLVNRLWFDLMAKEPVPPNDPKSELQEIAQAQQLPLPDYDVVDTQGPDHQPVFTVQVSLPPLGVGTGQGPSKKDAERAAAADLLEKINDEPE